MCSDVRMENSFWKPQPGTNIHRGVPQDVRVTCRREDSAGRPGDTRHLLRCHAYAAPRGEGFTDGVSASADVAALAGG